MTPPVKVPARTPKTGIVVTKTVAGMLSVDAADGIGGMLLHAGVYEPDVTKWVQRVVTPGMVCVDAGAHIGYFSVLMARLCGPTGRLLAIEPAPGNRALLRQNLIDAGVSAWSDVVDAALEAKAQYPTVPFYLDAANMGAHSLYADAVPNTAQTALVRVETLDWLLKAAGIGGRVDVVKMDIQGAEHSALLGASRLLAQPKLLLMVELWPHGLRCAGATVDDVFSLMAAAGFTAELLAGPGDVRAALAAKAGGRSSIGHLNLVFRKG